jgi:F0F1-type ATP synthase assembly protein I
MGRLHRWARRLVTGRGQDLDAFSLAHVGLTYGAAVALYGLGGWWLDGKLGTMPWFTLLGVILGAVGGFLWVYREVTRAKPPSRAGKTAGRERESKPP